MPVNYHVVYLERDQTVRCQNCLYSIVNTDKVKTEVFAKEVLN